LRSEIALPFYDFVADGVEDDCCGPAVVFVAIRKIGARVLVDADGEIFVVKEGENFGIAIGGHVHDMTPVAPDCFQIEEDETPLALSLGEYFVGPRLPVELRRCRVGGWLRLLRGCALRQGRGGQQHRQ